MFSRESKLLKDLKVSKRTGMVKFAHVMPETDEEMELDSASGVKKVLRKFKKSPDVPKGYVEKHEKNLSKGKAPKKVVTEFFEGLQDVKKSHRVLKVITAKLFRQHGIFKTADRNVYQDLATGDFWKISEDKSNVIRMFKEIDGVADRVSNRHSVMQKAAAVNVLNEGDKVKVTGLNDVSAEDFAMVESEYNKLLAHEGKDAVIESIEVLNNPNDSDENYYDIQFTDGYEVEAIAGVHLRKAAADSFKCPECGSEVMKSSGYCMKCKKKVTEASTVKEATPPIPSPKEEDYFKRKEIERKKNLNQTVDDEEAQFQPSKQEEDYFKRKEIERRKNKMQPQQQQDEEEQYEEADGELTASKKTAGKQEELIEC